LARAEVEVIRIVRLLRAAKRAEVEFAQIACGLDIYDLGISACSRPDTDRRITVVAQAEIEHEPSVHAPIILNKRAIFVEMAVMSGLAVLQNDGIRNVVIKIVQVLERNIRILRIRLASTLAIPAHAQLHIVCAHDAAELLIRAPGAALQFEYLGTHGREQSGHCQQWNAAADHGLDGFGRPARIGHEPEILEPIEEAAIPADAAFGNPGSS